MCKSRLSVVWTALVVLMLMALAPLQVPMFSPASATAKAVNLPHALGTDSAGVQWMVYHQGWLQQQGNIPIYSQGARLSINGSQAGARTNTAELDEKTGEVVLADMQAGSFLVTRRIRIDSDAGFVRYIDLVRNTTDAEQSLNLQLQTNTNYGIQSSQLIKDPGAKGDEPIGWAANTGANRAIVELYGGPKAKVRPTVNAPQGNSYIQVSYQMKLAKNEEVAFVHVHATADNAATGEKWVLGLTNKQIMAGIDSALKKKIVNFRVASQAIGEYEMLRDELFDIVELRSGDQFRGTLKNESYVLETFYGDVTLPVDRVIALLNVGDIRPRQLIVTRNGEVFGGQLRGESISLELSTGQTVQIPLSQISRMGYRRQADEPEEWTLDQPLARMQGGDRVGVVPPESPIEVMTRYGQLSLEPAAIAAIVFQAEENRVHEIQLRDGSRFAGLVMPEHFDMQLSGASTEQAVRFPTAALAVFQIAPPPDGPEAHAATVTLSNGDLLVGKLVGELKLNTTFDTLALNGPEIKAISRGERQGADVQITMWDATSVSGQLEQNTLEIHLDSGVQLRVPVTLVQEYIQPIPQPSASVIDRIKGLVSELDADDWKQRDRAEAQLTALGVPVISILKSVQGEQSPEARQRIEQILQRLQEQLKESPSR